MEVPEEFPLNIGGIIKFSINFVNGKGLKDEGIFLVNKLRNFINNGILQLDEINDAWFFRNQTIRILGKRVILKIPKKKENE